MDVIDEVRAFPTGLNDDFVDTVTQALIWMRNGGYVVNSKDTWLDKREQEIYNRSSRHYY